MVKTGEPLPTNHLLDGRYRIAKVIGQGGMGRVYLANDSRLANRSVAVKEMVVGEGLHEQKAVEDFAREARVLAPLSHPGIPNLIDYFVESGRHYLVMEYISGGDLQGWLDKRGAGAKVPEDQVVKWTRQILDVLAFLHGQAPPIIYRDLKPGNIMIDGNGRAMIIDFGIARFLPPGGRGTSIGSVGYASPEQYLGKLEPRSDLYSLGATMHHLLTGRDPQLEPPFSFPPVRQLAPEVSIEIETVVMRALEQDAAKRPSSAAEMSRLLPDSARGSTLGGPAADVSSTGSPAVSTMRTVVLTRAASPAPPSSKASKGPARQPASVSSTAKTADLRGKLSVVPNPPAKRATPLPPTRVINAKPMQVALTSSPAPSRTIMAQPIQPVASPIEPQAWGRLVSKGQPLEFVLRGSSMVVGRAKASTDKVDVDLGRLQSGADRISRRHAEIMCRGADCFIRDLGSLNGTFILGRGRLGRDQLYQLKDRDQVVFGGATFEFRKGESS